MYFYTLWHSPSPHPNSSTGVRRELGITEIPRKLASSPPFLHHCSMLRFDRESFPLTLAMMLLIWNRPASRRLRKYKCCITLGSVQCTWRKSHRHTQTTVWKTGGQKGNRSKGCQRWYRQYKGGLESKLQVCPHSSAVTLDTLPSQCATAPSMCTVNTLKALAVNLGLWKYRNTDCAGSTGAYF